MARLGAVSRREPWGKGLAGRCAQLQGTPLARAPRDRPLSLPAPIQGISS